jgi:hypothetical protein
MSIADQIVQVAPAVGRVLIPIGFGLFLRVIGLFGDEEGALLRKFVVRFTVPIFVLFSLYEARPDSIAAIAPMMAAFVLLTAVLFLMGWAVARRLRTPAERTAVHACVTFGNYGWMGLGVGQALLGAGGAQRALYFFLLWWPVFYAFGLTIGFIHTRGQKGGVPVRHAVAVAAPPIVALVVGLVLNVCKVPLPGVAYEVLKPFGDMTVPLILLSVGMMLDWRTLNRGLRPAALASVITLAVAPVVGWGLAALLTRDAVSAQAIILEAAMPVATLTPLLEENFEMDKDLVNTAIVLSTVLSFATLPVVAMLVL